MTQAERNSEATGNWVVNEFFWDSVFAELLSSLVSKKLTVVGGLGGAAVSFAAAAVHRLAGPTVLVTPSVADAESIRDDLRGILDEVLYFPAYETLPFEGEPAHPGVISDRVECMAELFAGEKKKPCGDAGIRSYKENTLKGKLFLLASIQRYEAIHRGT